MKLVIYRKGEPPIELDGAERVRVLCGGDHFEMREREGLLVQLEMHDRALAMDLAMFPNGSNGVRLKGGLR